MRFAGALLGAALLFLGAFAGYGLAEGKTVAAACAYGNLNPVFSPGAEPHLRQFLEEANTRLDVEVFEFSNAGLRAELQDAAARGVRVRVLLDAKVDQNLKTAPLLKKAGVRVRWSSPKYVYTHAKYAIADGERVFVGSINWSYNAMTRNREAALDVDSKEVAGQFESIFEQDWLEGTDVNS